MGKIALLVRSAQQGGVESHVYELLRNIPSLGYHPVLISLSDGPIDYRFRELGIEIISLKDKKARSFRSLSNVFYLYKALKKLKPEIVHCHGTRPIFIGTIAAKMAGIKTIIVTVHNSYKLMTYDDYGIPKRNLLALSKVMHFMGFTISKCIITVSRSLADEIKCDFGNWPLANAHVNNKIKIIHNGFNSEKYKKITDNVTLKKSLNISNKLKVIGTVGRLEPMKGIHILLQATKYLFNAGYLFELIIVGDGRSRKDLEKLTIELGIKRNVHFLGYIEDPVDIYNIMDIFVLPSLSEGFAMVIVEAMACQLPVVSTNVGCASEIIIDSTNGIIVPTNNISEIANAIKRYLCDEGFSCKIGAEAMKTTTSYTNKYMVERTFSVYKSLAREET